MKGKTKKMKEKLVQFINDYQIWKLHDADPGKIYEKGDYKYIAFYGLSRSMVAVTFFGAALFYMLAL